MSSIKIHDMLLPLLVSGIATKQVYKDVKDADPSDKKNVLLRDVVILGGTCAGTLAGHVLFNKEVPNASGKIQKAARHLINNLSLPVGGIICGLIFGQQAEKTFPQKCPTIKEAVKETINSNLLEHQKRLYLINQSKIFADKVDMGTIGKAYNYLGISVGGLFDNTFSTLSGFKVGREKGLKNKLLKASNEIIAGVIIPVTTVVTTASYLKNKNINNFSKSLILAPVAIASCYIGNIAGKWFNKKITENIIKEEFWDRIAERQKNWKTNLLTSGFSFNQIKAQQLALEKLKDEIPKLSHHEEIQQIAVKHKTNQVKKD